MRIAPTAAVYLALFIAAGAGAPAPVGVPVPMPPDRAFLGACYCRAEGTLHCFADLSEQECRQRCDEALCDEWFWKERLPCWNWGYGG